MAISSSPSRTLDPKLEKPDPHPPISCSTPPTPSSSTPENPNPSLISPPPGPPAAASPAEPPSLPPFAHSFRPAFASNPSLAPVPAAPQFAPLPPNPNFPNPSLQPPGVSPVSIMLPGVASGAGAVSVSVSSMRPVAVYQPPNSALAVPSPYPQAPNGYPPVPTIPPLAYSLIHGEKDRQASSCSS